MRTDSTLAASARDYFDHLGELLSVLDAGRVDALAERVFEAWRENRQVLVCGNGGSASTASHYVTDFVKTAAVDGQRRLRALCLNDNAPMQSALGNDLGYEETFVYPLATYADVGDLLIAISGSGTSANVVLACEWACRNGLELAALTGFDGGTIGPMADLHLNVPSDNYGAIEDLHMSIGHIVTQTLHARVRAATTG
ncbi:MAG: SIS domain-containing protein [Myxococcota bacterium]